MDSTQIATVLVQQIRQSAGEYETVAVGCDCHNENFLVEDVQWRDHEGVIEKVARLIEHALHDHTFHGALHIQRTATLLEGFRLGQLAGVPARTEYEENWRELNPL